MNRSALSACLRIFVSLGAMAAVFWSQRAHLSDALQIVRHEVSWAWFFLGLATYLAALAMLSVRLRLIFRVQEIALKFREVYYLTFIGLFFNLFLPSAVGGDISKVYYAQKQSGKKMESATAVILDRLMGFATLILMALAALLVMSREFTDVRIYKTVYFFLALFFGMLLFLMSRRIARRFLFVRALIPSEKLWERLQGLYFSIYGFKRHGRVIAATFLLSLAGQCLFVLKHYWVAASLGVFMSPWLFFVLVPLLSIISMAPSIGGLGVREAGVLYLFKAYMPNERALALSLLLDMLIYGVSFISGAVYALRGGLRENVMHEIREVQ